MTKSSQNDFAIPALRAKELYLNPRSRWDKTADVSCADIDHTLFESEKRFHSQREMYVGIGLQSPLPVPAAGASQGCDRPSRGIAANQSVIPMEKFPGPWRESFSRWLRPRRGTTAAAEGLVGPEGWRQWGLEGCARGCWGGGHGWLGEARLILSAAEMVRSSYLRSTLPPADEGAGGCLSQGWNAERLAGDIIRRPRNVDRGYAQVLLLEELPERWKWRV
ncbi:hypothetical protein KM043_003402 [Ampulex compressa]|nr:hypothetical protein KM043_003402 [Ampulex compressa]